MGVIKEATEDSPEWYKAWHAWALVNVEAVAALERQGVGSEGLVGHVTTAIDAFFRSIALGPEQPMQDTLRVLTLMFKHGRQAEVERALLEGCRRVRVDTWLQVIPQLIARIGSPARALRRLTHALLEAVGARHPQALVYPLAVASKTPSAARLGPARELLERLRVHHPALVEQALLVSRELRRVAILWHEMWHEGLGEASRAFAAQGSVDAMLAVLAPLHALLEEGPETLSEHAFADAYGDDLRAALAHCRRYQRAGRAQDVQQAWALYGQVYRRLSAQLPQLAVLDLPHVAPALARQRDMELAVPGTYRAGEPVVRIARVHPVLAVIASKQRPRKLTLVGSNGADYKFLLKGHEDLRQDERVMQLFGLVNTLLDNDAETSKSHLSIACYAVIPLSPNSGLIGWVPHSDTLHALVRDYRDARRIVLNTEHRLMLQMAPHFDTLTVPQKVEVFQHALDTTDGGDLAHVLWLKSATSESWLERRTCYTRSVAVMSMVGYILGLGDRHPSTLMLDRTTGQVVHIDFGDCFEVAMHRDKFPERIPFRLTRMLVNAMEVSGIEGTFRFTCQKVMRLLRANKDSLMAVLEAFVYDPLINWRLLSHPQQQQQQQQQQVKDPSESGSFSAHSCDALSTDACSAVASLSSFGGASAAAETSEEKQDEIDHDPLNRRALSVIRRVSKKLTGCDFDSANALDVKEQVSKLIEQATSHENLCQCYVGWCPFW